MNENNILIYQKTREREMSEWMEERLNFTVI